MNVAANGSGAGGLAALRNLVRKDVGNERCDLCSVRLSDRHQHLVDAQARCLLCACDACAILFGSRGETKYRRVPRDVRFLRAFHLSDQCWSGFAIPIGLAFLYGSSAAQQILAVYPSPAGPTEASVDSDAWQELLAENPVLSRLNPDVEALLINRLLNAREYFIAPIDECYKLTGLIRKHWRGLSGGDDAWQQISAFFERLKSECYVEAVR